MHMNKADEGNDCRDSIHFKIHCFSMSSMALRNHSMPHSVLDVEVMLMKYPVPVINETNEQEANSRTNDPIPSLMVQ